MDYQDEPSLSLPCKTHVAGSDLTGRTTLQEVRQWRAWVAFAPPPFSNPLLGFAGCLQFFTATFHGDREEVELTVNRLYPGT